MSRRSVKPLRLSLGEKSMEGEMEVEDSGANASSSRNAQARFEGKNVASNGPTKIEVDLRRLRSVICASLSKNLFKNAIFFANKLVTLSAGQPRDVHLLAQAYYLGKQYRRAVNLIQQHGFLISLESTRPSTGHNLENSSGNVGGESNSSSSGASNTSRSPRFSFESSKLERRRTVAIDENVEFVLLAVQCLIEDGQHEEAQSVLENILGDASIDALRARARDVPSSINALLNAGGTQLSSSSSSSSSSYSSPLTGKEDDHEWDVNPIASLCLLRGQVYETLDNRPRAAQWYRAALFCDVHCYEAFDALVDNQLRPSGEKQLMSELERVGAFEGGAAWLKAVYNSRLGKHDFGQRVEERFATLDSVMALQDPSEEYIDTKVHNLGAADLDCLADKAEALYQQHDPQGAYQVTRRIQLMDPYQMRCIAVHLASLVELRRKSELFHTAHNLVDAYPSLAVSWFAVGCYYYCISRFDAARRFFHKATSMDPGLAVAWLGFGHSFAAQDESDQAMAAYRTAARLFTGSHLPVLCTAIEYLRTNNVTLAEQFCRQAKTMCATDPLVFNELGVVHYRQQRFSTAVDCFEEALKLCKHRPERLRYAWEPAMFNLGHSYRKMGKYDKAIQQYQNALSYSPKEASIYAALGLTYHLQSKVEQAIQNYHNALGLKPEDTFSSEMLDKALEESFQKSTLSNGLFDKPEDGMAMFFGSKSSSASASAMDL